MLKFFVGLGLATALLAAGCAAPPATPSPPRATQPPLAIGTPLGPEPEGWEDLRDVPFELHLLPENPDGPPEGTAGLALELRPGGTVVTDFDGTRAMPFVLYRDGTRRFNEVPVTYGSGAVGTAVSPYRGWEAALPLWIHPPPGETVLREIVLEIDFVRLLEWKDTEVVLDAGGVLDPVPPPLAKKMVAERSRLWLSNPRFRKRGEEPTPRPYPFDPYGDLLQARDSRGRGFYCSGGSVGGGTDDTWFIIRGSLEESIATDRGIAEVPIAYPVAMRFRMPLRWSARTYRFVLRDVPLDR